MSKRTRQLVVELHELLAGPDEREKLEMIIKAELQVAAVMRRIFGTDMHPLVPTHVLQRFESLREMTNETGDAWAGRVDRVLQAAGDPTGAPAEPADPMALMEVRRRVIG